MSSDDWDDKSTLFHAKHDPKEIEPFGFRIELRAGPDAGLVRIIPPDAPTRILVGTSPACDVRLTDRRTSRRHVALNVEGGRLRVTDQASTNGTRIDGVAVVDAYVEEGASIAIGDSLIDVARINVELGAASPLVANFGRFVGSSSVVRRLYPLFTKIALSNVPVIIEGETGTGKEMLAEALHETGPRSSGPFVVFDCTTIPPNLMESELFGHEKGAFSGASSSRKGIFEQAHNGTLLIDEIGDLDLALQPKLLRAIEKGSFRRVGGERTITAEVRVLAATRRDLDEMVSTGTFRDDLFHRLAVARIELPPLRSRRDDVVVLAEHFWRTLGGHEHGPSPLLLRRWQNYAWPGNVRELRNAISRALALGPAASVDALGGTLRSQAGVDVIERVLDEALPLSRARELVVEEFERRYVEKLLAEHGGNIVRAAAAAGVARRYFQVLKTKLGR